MARRRDSLINKRTLKHFTNKHRHYTSEEYAKHGKAMLDAAHLLISQNSKLQIRHMSSAVKELIQAFFGNPKSTADVDKALGFITILSKQSVMKFNVINLILHSDDKTVSKIASKLVQHKQSKSTSTSTSTHKKVGKSKDTKVIK